VARAGMGWHLGNLRGDPSSLRFDATREFVSLGVPRPSGLRSEAWSRKSDLRCPALVAPKLREGGSDFCPPTSICAVPQIPVFIPGGIIAWVSNAG